MSGSCLEDEKAVPNPERYLPSRQLIRKELDAGKLGEVGLVRLHRFLHRTEKASDQAPLPSPLLRDLDVALWLIGKFPEVVYAVEPSAEDDKSPGRFIQVHLGFPGGAMALVDYCDRLPPGDGYQSLHVIGSAGAAYADDQANMQLLFRGGRAEAVLAPERQEEWSTAARDYSGDSAAWQNVLAVAQAVNRSLQSREAIRPEGTR